VPVFGSLERVNTPAHAMGETDFSEVTDEIPLRNILLQKAPTTSATNQSWRCSTNFDEIEVIWCSLLGSALGRFVEFLSRHVIPLQPSRPTNLAKQGLVKRLRECDLKEKNSGWGRVVRGHISTLRGDWSWEMDGRDVESLLIGGTIRTKSRLQVNVLTSLFYLLCLVSASNSCREALARSEITVTRGTSGSRLS
jgi:hypothetical protein